MESEGDSDAPEELTSEQGIKQDEEIRKIQRENKNRVVQEGKERRRELALKKIKSKSDKESSPKDPVSEAREDAPSIRGMLPSNIVNFLVTREKQTFASDSEEEVVDHEPPKPKKRRNSTTGPETVLLRQILPARCSENSMEFLKARKMKVSRSNSVLKNAKQALRFLSTPGNLLGNSQC